jgi:hypothetical protein
MSKRIPKSAKAKPPKRSPKAKDALSIEVLGWLQEKEMEHAADYVRRGRRHVSLSGSELHDAWITAFEAFAADPLNPALRMTHDDLKAESDLRGLVVPRGAVTVANEILISKVRQMTVHLAPGENWETFGEAILEALVKRGLLRRN